MADLRKRPSGPLVSSPTSSFLLLGLFLGLWTAEFKWLAPRLHSKFCSSAQCCISHGIHLTACTHSMASNCTLPFPKSFSRGGSKCSRYSQEKPRAGQEWGLKPTERRGLASTSELSCFCTAPWSQGDVLVPDELMLHRGHVRTPFCQRMLTTRSLSMTFSYIAMEALKAYHISCNPRLCPVQ